VNFGCEVEVLEVLSVEDVVSCWRCPRIRNNMYVLESPDFLPVHPPHLWADV